MGNTGKDITYQDVLDILDMLEEHAPNWVAVVRGYVTKKEMETKEQKEKISKMVEIFDPHGLLFNLN